MEVGERVPNILVTSPTLNGIPCDDERFVIYLSIFVDLNSQV